MNSALGHVTPCTPLGMNAKRRAEDCAPYQIQRASSDFRIYAVQKFARRCRPPEGGTPSQAFTKLAANFRSRAEISGAISRRFR